MRRLSEQVAALRRELRELEERRGEPGARPGDVLAASSATSGARCSAAATACATPPAPAGRRSGARPRTSSGAATRRSCGATAATTSRYRPPVVIVHSLVSRSYVLDLYPGNSAIAVPARAQGLDVFLLDWGVADEAEAGNTLETYADDYIPEAVAAACEAAGPTRSTLLGYCFGGVLSLLAAARQPELPIRNLVADGHAGRLRRHAGDHRARARGPPRARGRASTTTGNVPPEAVENAFRLLKPTAEYSQYANLWENLWNDEYMEGYQAMGQWTRDHVPFPGAAFRQTVERARARQRR